MRYLSSRLHSWIETTYTIQSWMKRSISKKNGKKNLNLFPRPLKNKLFKNPYYLTAIYWSRTKVKWKYSKIILYHRMSWMAKATLNSICIDWLIDRLDYVGNLNILLWIIYINNNESGTSEIQFQDLRNWDKIDRIYSIA